MDELKRAHDGALARSQSERRKATQMRWGTGLLLLTAILAGEAHSQSASSPTTNALTCGTLAAEVLASLLKLTLDDLRPLGENHGNGCPAQRPAL